MTTLEQIANEIKKLDSLIDDFHSVANILIKEELTLMDIVANEEQAKEITSDMVDTLKNIVRLRQWLDFERADDFNRPF